MKKLKFLSIIAIAILLTAPMALAAGQWSPLFTKKQPGGIYGVIDTSKTTGDIWYVDSGTGTDGAGYGRNPLSPTATLDYIIELTTASNGDVIYVAAGHAESGSAANLVDIDKAGLRVEGLGDGANRPSFTFADTDTTFAIGAANVTVKNLQFIAGISAVVIGVAVEAAGDNFTLEGCVFPEPTTSSFEFVDAIDLAAGADSVHIIGNTFFNADATGGGHFVEAGNGVNNDLQIIDNYIYGEFAVAAIWSDTADLEVLIKDNYIFNMTSGQHAVEFTSTALGAMINNTFVGDTYLNTVDPGSLSMRGNTISVGIDAPAEAFPQYEDGARRSCIKVSSGLVAGDDALFVIAGGPIVAQIYGYVTDTIGSTPTNLSLEMDVTNPSGTIQLNAGAVACEDDAIGTAYWNMDADCEFTVTTAGTVIFDQDADFHCTYVLPIGTVVLKSSGANATHSVIQWTMIYEAGPGVTVTAAP